jgi:hypothetical protein
MAHPTTPGPLVPGFFGGALPSPDDDRDHLFGVAALAQLPTTEIRLDDLLPACTDQDHTNACAAHTATKLRTALARKWHLSQGHNLGDFEHELFSDRYQYFWTRVLMGTFPADSGSYMREMCKAMHQHGAVLDQELPWDPATAQQAIAEDLTDRRFESARFFGISGYQRVGFAGMDMVGSLVAALRARNPVALGFEVFPSFFEGQSGHSPMPRPGEQSLGGHAVPVYAFIPDGGAPGGGWFQWRGSWGPGFGDHGDGYLSVSYVASSHTWEAWTLS